MTGVSIERRGFDWCINRKTGTRVSNFLWRGDDRGPRTRREKSFGGGRTRGGRGTQDRDERQHCLLERRKRASENDQYIRMGCCVCVYRYRYTRAYRYTCVYRYVCVRTAGRTGVPCTLSRESSYRYIWSYGHVPVATGRTKGYDFFWLSSACGTCAYLTCGRRSQKWTLRLSK